MWRDGPGVARSSSGEAGAAGMGTKAGGVPLWDPCRYSIFSSGDDEDAEGEAAGDDD